MSEKKKAKKIGILGGSFNPPHYGHLLAAVYARQRFALDEIWYVPTYQHAFGKPLVPFAHRLAMLRLLIQGLGSSFKVSTIERQIRNPGRALRTLEVLQERHPHHHFRWIIGSDLVRETRRWFEVGKLERRFGFLVVPRDGSSAEPVRIPDYQSTTFRRARSVEKRRLLTAPAIVAFAEKHDLY